MRTVRLYTAEEVTALLNSKVVANATPKAGKPSNKAGILNSAFESKSPVTISYKNSFNKQTIKELPVFLRTEVKQGKNGEYIFVAFKEEGGKWKNLSLKGITIKG